MNVTRALAPRTRERNTSCLDTTHQCVQCEIHDDGGDDEHCVRARAVEKERHGQPTAAVLCKSAGVRGVFMEISRVLHVHIMLVIRDP
jgi:hypothetical protein